MILMDTILDFAFPDKTPAEFIEISPFSENDVPFLEQIAIFFLDMDSHRLHLAQIKITGLNIRNSQIRKSDGFPFINLPPFGHPSLDGAALPQRDYLPTLRHQPNLSLFLRFAAEPFGKELLHERLFQFRGQSDQPLLLLNGPLNHPQHPGNLPLFGEIKFIGISTSTELSWFC